MKLFLLIFLAFVPQNLSQPSASRFILNVAHYTLPNLESAVYRCVASAITERHVLSTASCVSVNEPSQGVAIVAEVAAENSTRSIPTSAITVTVHPNYVAGEELLFNVAVVLTQFSFTAAFQSRQLGVLQSNTDCSLFGWGGAFLDSRQDSVSIVDSELCDPNFPDIFCSVFETADHETCDAVVGSPVICGNALAGFLINNRTCTIVGDQHVLKYHSVGDFGEWIKAVTSDESIENPARFILNVASYTVPDIDTAVSRCVASAITNRHVLTTATCVSVDNSQGIIIQAVVTNNNETRTTSTLPIRVSIHPDYTENEDNFSNIAVILTRFSLTGTFRPRLLGGLQPNILCNLHGWGGDLTYPRNDLVTVRGSEFCNSNSTDAFCTIFDTQEHETCSAILGSPIVCRNEIAGFALNNGTCTSVDENQNFLNYQSIGDFYDWIYETTTYSTVENTVRFIVNVAHYTFPDLETAIVRCAASIITNVHVLTTATCVNIKSPLAIAVQATTTTENSNSSVLLAVQRVFIHPDFKENENNVANIAVILTPFFFGGTFRPRPISELQANTVCELFGWGGGLQNPRRDLVTILHSKFCNLDFPDVFCSTFASENHGTCSAMLSSPVICGNIISGFLINDGTCSSNQNNQTTLSYHSVGDFADWIQRVTSNEPEIENNERFIVNIMQFTSGSIHESTFRCSGSIIAPSHVLTTASCGKVPEPFEIAIQISTEGGTSTFSVERVFIHPDFMENRNGSANIAVIRTFSPFDSTVFTPQYLGKLQSNHSCHLHGWSASYLETRRDAVTVFGPEFCDPSSPKLFCSTFSSPAHKTCQARLGSAVICDNSTISGILINEESCNSVESNNLLSYQSVDDYQDWIRQVSVEEIGSKLETSARKFV